MTVAPAAASISSTEVSRAPGNMISGSGRYSSSAPSCGLQSDRLPRRRRRHAVDDGRRLGGHVGGAAGACGAGHHEVFALIDAAGDRLEVERERPRRRLVEIERPGDVEGIADALARDVAPPVGRAGEAERRLGALVGPGGLGHGKEPRRRAQRSR